MRMSRSRACRGHTGVQHSYFNFLVGMRAAHPPLNHTAAPAHGEIYTFRIAVLHSLKSGGLTLVRGSVQPYRQRIRDRLLSPALAALSGIEIRRSRFVSFSRLASCHFESFSTS